MFRIFSAVQPQQTLTQIGLNIRKCITLCNLSWNPWCFPCSVGWLPPSDDKDIPAACSSMPHAQTGIGPEKIKSHLLICVFPWSRETFPRDPVVDRPLGLNVCFKLVPVIGTSPQDLRLELEMRSPSPAPLGGWMASENKGTKQQHPAPPQGVCYEGRREEWMLGRQNS